MSLLFCSAAGLIDIEVEVMIPVIVLQEPKKN